ncbi:hypothetical protein L2E82_53892 [Cichorium intybus]|nr:hypothetical protein L2E82_53892 [Cichorium intybus]
MVIWLEPRAEKKKFKRNGNSWRLQRFLSQIFLTLCRGERSKADDNIREEFQPEVLRSERETGDSTDDESLEDSDKEVSDFLSDEEVEKPLGDPYDETDRIEGGVNDWHKSLSLGSENCFSEKYEEAKVEVSNDKEAIDEYGKENVGRTQESSDFSSSGPAPQDNLECFSSGSAWSPIGESNCGKSQSPNKYSYEQLQINRKPDINVNDGGESDFGAPVELIGVSEKMKLLLSTNTPLKEKLERISNEISDQNSNQKKFKEEARSDRMIPPLERRVTRSQSTQWKGKDERKWKQKEKDESCDSTQASVGIANRFEEIGGACGFFEAKQKRKTQIKVSKIGDFDGKP